MRTQALLVTAALAAGSCAPRPADEGLERRLAELEGRVADVEARLATVPDEAGLESAGVDELVRRLGSEDDVRRLRAVRALVAMDAEEELLAFFDGAPEHVREGIAAVLARTASLSSLHVLAELHAAEQAPRVRALLATALARTGAEEAVDPLLLDLEADSTLVRLAAVRALGRLGSPRAGGALLRLAAGPDADVATLARRALARLPEEAFLFVGLEWDRLGPRARVDAIGALEHLPGERARAFLAEQLRDASPVVALSAARALAEQGDASGRELAVQRLSSDDEIVARLAREVLDVLAAVP